MEKLLKEFREDLAKFREMTDKFYAKVQRIFRRIWKLCSEGWTGKYVEIASAWWKTDKGEIKICS